MSINYICYNTKSNHYILEHSLSLIHNDEDYYKKKMKRIATDGLTIVSVTKFNNCFMYMYIIIIFHDTKQ